MVSTQILSGTKDLINYTPKRRLTWVCNQQQRREIIVNEELWKNRDLYLQGTIVHKKGSYITAPSEQ